MRRSKGVRSECGRAAATSLSVTAGVCTLGDVCPEDEADSAGAACRRSHCRADSKRLLTELPPCTGGANEGAALHPCFATDLGACNR